MCGALLLLVWHIVNAENFIFTLCVKGGKGCCDPPPFPLNNPPFPRKRSTRFGLPFWPTKIFAALGSNFLNQRVQQREIIRVDLTQNGYARKRSAKADMRAPIGIYRMKKREDFLSLLLICTLCGFATPWGRTQNGADWTNGTRRGYPKAYSSTPRGEVCSKHKAIKNRRNSRFANSFLKFHSI